ncbi:MAG: T9SS type A sorting domain-containing protein [Saprospiraceae bacterium]
MKYIFTTGLLLMALLAAAQSIDREVINSIGFQIDEVNFSINQSIGESVISHIEGPDFILTEGFLQYFEVSNASEDFESLYGSVYPSPNPSNGIFSLKNLSAENLTGKITDLQGRVLWNGTINGTIETQTLPAGHYVLLVFDDNYRFKSFPIQIYRP